MVQCCSTGRMSATSIRAATCYVGWVWDMIHTLLLAGFQWPCAVFLPEAGSTCFHLCRGSRLPLAGRTFTGSTTPRNSCIFCWATRSQLPFAAGGKLAYPGMTRLRALNSETQVTALLLLSSTFQAGLCSIAYITGTSMGSFTLCALLLPFFFYSSSDSIVGTQVCARMSLRLTSKLGPWCASHVFTIPMISRPTLSTMRFAA